MRLVLPLTTRLYAGDFLIPVGSAVVSSVLVSVFAMHLFYVAIVSVLPPTKLFSDLLTVKSISEFSTISVRLDSIATGIANMFTGLYISNLWIILLVTSPLGFLAAFPLVSRAYVQLPTLLFRAEITPYGLALRLYGLVLISSLPVCLQTLIIPFIMLWNYNLLHYISFDQLATLVLVSLLSLFPPILGLQAYLASGRVDLSLVASILIALILYVVCVNLHSLIAYVLAFLVHITLNIFVLRRRLFY